MELDRADSITTYPRPKSTPNLRCPIYLTEKGDAFRINVRTNGRGVCEAADTWGKFWAATYRSSWRHDLSSSSRLGNHSSSAANADLTRVGSSSVPRLPKIAAASSSSFRAAAKLPDL
jgi:hypothetical protein